MPLDGRCGESPSRDTPIGNFSLRAYTVRCMKLRSRSHSAVLRACVLSLSVISPLFAGCSVTRPAEVPPARQAAPIRADTQIISSKVEGSSRELLQRGERALLAQEWSDAVTVFEALVAANLDDSTHATALYDLATAYEGAGLQAQARDRFHEYVARYPTSHGSRGALQRAAFLHAQLEEWDRLGATGTELLTRSDLEPADRMAGLGARGLSRVELGDISGAAHDVQEGLDIVDELHWGAAGRLPVSAAMLRFALGEVRRAKEEQIALLPVTPDFLAKINARCQGLLLAQSAFADAIRSVDPKWAAMSGYRIGEMYRALHRDLMAIPPQNAHSAKDRELFYGMMHMRYRALLDKGVEMMRRTLELAEKTNDGSSWIRRAEESKHEMEVALEVEKAEIQKSAFTEAELERALEVLEKQTLNPEKNAKGGPARTRTK